MNTEKMLMIIDRPHTSEKTTILSDKLNQYTFKVAKTACKNDVKQAVEYLFNVKVKKITISIVKGKTKRFRQHMGKRQDWKKAYVCLESGSEIVINEAE